MQEITGHQFRGDSMGTAPRSSEIVIHSARVGQGQARHAYVWSVVPTVQIKKRSKTGLSRLTESGTGGGESGFGPGNLVPGLRSALHNSVPAVKQMDIAQATRDRRQGMACCPWRRPRPLAVATQPANEAVVLHF